MSPMSTTTRARLAALESWAGTRDRTARTAPARTGLLDRFERQARERLGPGATGRQIADAAHAIKAAHYQRMSAAGVAARAARRR